MIDADGVEWRFGEYLFEGPPGLAQVNKELRQFQEQANV